MTIVLSPIPSPSSLLTAEEEPEDPYDPKNPHLGKKLALVPEMVLAELASDATQRFFTIPQ